MAAQKPLQLVAGVPTEVSALDSSAGAGDAGKIVALDAAGLLNANMMPAGIGQNLDSIVSFENLAAGDFVNIFDDTGTIKVRKADANGKKAHGFVLAAVTAPAAASVYGPGELNSQLSGLTIGAEYFLSETPGAVTTTAPTTSGAYVQPLGVAKATTAIRMLDTTVYVRA